MMFLLLCPQCKHKMKYQTLKPLTEKNKKRCVYCGKSFIVRNTIVKEL